MAKTETVRRNVQRAMKEAQDTRAARHNNPRMAIMESEPPAPAATADWGSSVSVSAEPQGEIWAKLSQLESATMILEHNLDFLRDKLAPVVRAEDSGEANGETPTMTPMGQRLQHLIDRTIAQSSLVASLGNRLEI